MIFITAERDFVPATSQKWRTLTKDLCWYRTTGVPHAVDCRIRNLLSDPEILTGSGSDPPKGAYY
jgi:hypothetical protein